MLCLHHAIIKGYSTYHVIHAAPTTAARSTVPTGFPVTVMCFLIWNATAGVDESDAPRWVRCSASATPIHPAPSSAISGGTEWLFKYSNLQCCTLSGNWGDREEGGFLRCTKLQYISLRSGIHYCIGGTPALIHPPLLSLPCLGYRRHVQYCILTPPTLLVRYSNLPATGNKLL